jgi:hypothetical protein
MRHDDASRHTTDPLPPPVRVQPDPMLEERPAGPLRVVAMALAAVAIIALVLYGVTRSPEPQQMAAPSEGQTAPAGGGAANNAGQPAQSATNAPPQSTPGQGAGQGAAQGASQGTGQAAGGQANTTGQAQSGGQTGQAKTPPASGGSATSAVGPGAKPAPAAR